VLTNQGAKAKQSAMLDIPDTGYEGRFDFPAVGGEPRMTYMIATVPRSGSTYLSHLLWKTGSLGAPLEYLNFDPLGPYFFAAGNPQGQIDLWRSVKRRRTSPNGIFGFKCFLMQLAALEKSNRPLLADLGAERVIYLRRRDRIAHAVSLARAMISGIWDQRQVAGEEPAIAYSQSTIEEAERAILWQEAGWEKLFARQRLEPLRLFYEDVVASPGESIGRIAQHLGVEIEGKEDVRVPEMVRQSGEESKIWAERYARWKHESGAKTE
jgi:trehalose 2-sulfotransferase